jgi:transcriptional regulator with XRE-family HTH domain
MQSVVRDGSPQAEETLGKYIQRLRTESSSTQKELSLKAGIHIQTIRKIEAGLTNRLNQKAKSGLAAALGIPQDYLDAVIKKVPVATISAFKFCPQCWTPGTTPDPMWILTVRSFLGRVVRSDGSLIFREGSQIAMKGRYKC